MKINYKICFFTSIILILLSILAAAGFCLALEEKDVSSQVQQDVETAIRIHQKIQADRTKWAQDKAELVLRYESLLQQKKNLEQEKETLTEQKNRLEELNRALIHQKQETVRIQRELSPFLEAVHARLETFVANDSPFLHEERAGRLEALSKTMNDPDVPVSEKYRKVMEALFIEAEYGATIEVYQDKAVLESTGQEAVLGNILRLGRVSLFFLSMDRAACAVFNPGMAKWQQLPDTMLGAVRSAVEIAAKRRPAELLPLPVGRLAAKGAEK